MGEGQKFPVEIEVGEAPKDLLPVIYAEDGADPRGGYVAKFPLKGQSGDKYHHGHDKDQGRRQFFVLFGELFKGRVVFFRQMLAHEQIAREQEKHDHA